MELDGREKELGCLCLRQLLQRLLAGRGGALARTAPAERSLAALLARRAGAPVRRLQSFVRWEPELTKCTLQVFPDDAETAPAELFELIKAAVCPATGHPGVRWIGYQAEPFAFGIQVLVPSCTLENYPEGSSVGLVRWARQLLRGPPPTVSDDWKVTEAIEGLESVQSVKLRSLQSFDGDPFEICGRIFDKVGLPSEASTAACFEAGIAALRAGQADATDVRATPGAAEPAGAAQSQATHLLGAADVRQLVTQGYCVLDGLVDAADTDALVELVSGSVAAWKQKKQAAETAAVAGAAEAGSADAADTAGAAAGEDGDGIMWFEPGPRTARSDVTVWLKPDSPPADTPLFAPVARVFAKLQAELAQFARLNKDGKNEWQLAWYPSESSGYYKHTDAPPDDGSQTGRKITCILYCNRGWAPSDGGQLRIWLSETNGGGTVEVEPVAGRVLIFLSGCMPHQVLPSGGRERLAVTSWLW